MFDMFVNFSSVWRSSQLITDTGKQPSGVSLMKGPGCMVRLSQIGGGSAKLPYPSRPSVCWLHASSLRGVLESAETSAYLQIQKTESPDFDEMSPKRSIDSCMCVLASGPNMESNSLPEQRPMAYLRTAQPLRVQSAMDWL